MKYCEECGRPYPEKHHVIFRSQGGFDVGWNYKYLCYKCHKGMNGPHRKKSKDLQYKRELQTLLNERLCNEYYTPIQIKEIFIKTLKRHKEGYKSSKLIIAIMGRNYLEEVA